jgi:fructosamine-3-kinase
MKPTLARAIEAALGASVASHRAVGGGSINDTFLATLSDGRRVFVKSRDDADDETFAIEAEGLSWLREGFARSAEGFARSAEGFARSAEGFARSAEGSLYVPEVLAVLARPRALVLRAFERGVSERGAFERGPDPKASEEALGRGLAQLHASLAEDARFGLPRASDLATIRFANTPTTDWPTFYAEQRLLPLLAHAERRRVATTRMRLGLERVTARLPELVGPPERAARLHGDLWSGNAAFDRAGRPVIFDPAVYAGHREIDLAMMKLFGGFSSRVFDAYDELWPRAPGHEERVPLYQLLPLLAHVVLFGGSYVATVESTLARLA